MGLGLGLGWQEHACFLANGPTRTPSCPYPEPQHASFLVDDLSHLSEDLVRVRVRVTVRVTLTLNSNMTSLSAVNANPNPNPNPSPITLTLIGPR